MWTPYFARSGAVMPVPRAAYGGMDDILHNNTMDPRTTHALVWTWLGFNIAGQVLLGLLLATFLFSKRLKCQRHPVMVNFVVTWLLSTFPACLLLYGNGHEGREPDFGLCLYNAALVSGAPPMLSMSFFAMVIQVYAMMRSVSTQKTYVRKTWFTALLIALPYVALITFSVITGVVGFLDPNNVTRDAEVVFCSVRHHNFGTIIWGFTIFIEALTLILGGFLVVLLWRNWRDVRSNSVVDLQLIIRALCFAVFQVFLICTFILAIFQDNSYPPKFMQAIAPLTVFLIFSTQPDVIYSWFFCFRFGKDRDGARAIAAISAPVPITAPRDVEARAPEYDYQSYQSYQSGASLPPAMRGVPGLRVSTMNLTNA